MSEKTEKAVLAATVDAAGPRLEVSVVGWNQFTLDVAELKQLADRVLNDRRFCGDENHKALADGVLALIAESERLEVDNGSLRGSTKRMGEDASKMQKQARKLQREAERLKVENEALRKDAERYRFVRNPIGTSSPLAIWNEGKMPLFSGMADAVVDEFMGKEVLA